MTDPLGHAVTYAYDAAGDLTGVTDRDGNTTSYDYTPDHALSRIVDPEGNTPVRVEYDGEGRLKKTLDADQHVVWSPQVHALDAMIQQEGYTLQMFWDPPNGAASSIARDAAGRPTSVTSWRTVPGVGQVAETTQFAYDNSDRLVATVTADGAVVQWSYDGLGRLQRKVDELGHGVDYARDPRGWITKATRDPQPGSRTARWPTRSSGRRTW